VTYTVLENIISDLPDIKLSADRENKLRQLGVESRTTLAQIDLLLKKKARAQIEDFQAAGERLNEMARKRNSLEFQINLFNNFYSNTVLR
jgi:hypothetical protein